MPNLLGFEKPVLSDKSKEVQRNQGKREDCGLAGLSSEV
jgi:hypothetical protein